MLDNKKPPPTNYKKVCLFRIIERDYNKKGYHNQVTRMTKSENAEDCLPIIRQVVPYIGAKFMLDGCGLGKSIKLNLLYKVDQCNHSKALYLKPNSYLEDVNNKVHNHYVENSYKKIRKKITNSYGIKANNTQTSSNKANLEKYIIESDWIANYTNKTPSDCLLTCLIHASELYGL